VLGRPATARSQQLIVAHRWALGVTGDAINGGLSPTVEYWPSENCGVSASYSYFNNASQIGLRATYLSNSPYDIYYMWPRPYVGVGVGFLSVNQYWDYGGYSGPVGEIFGGFLQPLSDHWSIRAELGLSSYVGSQSYGYPNPFYSPVTASLGLFYHFGHAKTIYVLKSIP
jgi:hypothetical protein